MKNDLFIFQKGFNYSNDGDGNRLVYHLSGCNMHCPWCSNPEGLYGKGGGVSTDAVFSEVMSSKLLFFDGGGVTFTGGEPTLQFEPLLDILKRLHDEGINTAIETNGTCERMSELFPYLDDIICDIKHPFAVKCEAITGVSNEVTVRNIRLAVNAGKRIDLRIPLVNGYNCDDSAVDGFCSLICDFGAGVTLELLRYHEYGRDKYKKVGVNYSVSDGFVSDEAFSKIREKFTLADIKLIRT